MTTLLLAHRKFLLQTHADALWLRVRADAVRDIFKSINRKGAVTFAIVAASMGGIAIYIIMLGFSFHLGIALRSLTRHNAEEERLVQNMEVALRKEEGDLPDRHPALLGAMERVDAIRYLGFDSVTLLR